jgi:glutaminyl-tRNA synthetase
LENKEALIRNFIEQKIDKDNESNKYGKKVITRFPPEPNGYLHIGHAKSICLNFGIAKEFGGTTNLRFDDTNPVKEDVEYVESIKEDVKWLGFDWDNLYFASDYFDKMYEFAVKLIKSGKAFVCDLTPDEMREYRGDFTNPGKDSPFRNRTVEENLELFEKMKNGDFPDGEKVLRAKIDMKSSNMNMRDPVLYRIAHANHHNTGDKWCIYPMYDYAHPIEDALESITHSICTLEFEAHRPLYDWVLEELKDEFEYIPEQTEFARLELTNTVMSKRYLKDLVDKGDVDGWDDPRLPTISGLRRRGYTPQSIRNFAEMIGVSKSNSKVDVSMLEHSIREDLKTQAIRTMAVINPLKVVIINYPEDKIEYVEGENNSENEELGVRQIPFTREIYIEKEDFMEVAPNKKYKRLSLGEEVRLRHAYFIKCEDVIKDENGEIIELRCTYDVATKSGSGFKDRKPKGTLHWVSAKESLKSEVRLYDYLMIEDENGENQMNPHSLITLTNCYVEKNLSEVEKGTKMQFLRHGYFSVDTKDSTGEKLVFNRIVSLKSSFKPKK